MELTEHLEELAYDAAFWSLGLNDPDYDVAQLGRTQLLGENYAISIGIGGLSMRPRGPDFGGQ